MERQTSIQYFLETKPEEQEILQKVNIKSSIGPNGQLGLYSKVNISVGECVLAEKPFLKVPAKSASVETNEKHLETILSTISPETKTKLFNLSDKYQNFNPKIGKTIQGIVETNGLPMGEQKAGKIPSEAGLYSLFCRVNHSCIPNVHHFYNKTTQRQELYALRDIQPGEELVTNYFHVCGKTFKQRQALQKTKWNFFCCCERCTIEKMNEHVREVNDEQELMLNRLDEEISALSIFDPAKAVRRCKERLKLLECSKFPYDLVEHLRNISWIKSKGDSKAENVMFRSSPFSLANQKAFRVQ
eukprot:maker-scaffold_13-snap-gene-1.46-mRNA-1 protein AED:0.21 eAED:0.30 QI:42/0.5/0.33/1/0/0/3/0/300